MACRAIGWATAVLAVSALGIPAAAGASTAMAAIPGGYHISPFPVSGKVRKEWVKPFRLDIRPVSTQEYLAFVKEHPGWKRSRVKRLFADSTYLQDWGGDELPPPAASTGSAATARDRNRAVTRISWYAAKAFCSAQGKRLPTTAEWERVALQVPERMDSARYSAQILEWYSRPASADANREPPGARNAFGIRDLFGNVWEWTSDFNAAGPTDRGEVSASDGSFFCGGAAGQAKPGTDYAIFMRYAFRSSLKPEFTLSSLGFRCADDP